jgi:hypothetical protein
MTKIKRKKLKMSAEIGKFGDDFWGNYMGILIFILTKIEGINDKVRI